MIGYGTLMEGARKTLDRIHLSYDHTPEYAPAVAELLTKDEHTSPFQSGTEPGAPKSDACAPMQSCLLT